MKRLRVIHVYRTYFPGPPGGVREAIRQIILATRLFEIDSKIFTLTPTQSPVDIQRPEGEVIRCRSWAAPASCDLAGPSAFKRFAEITEWADVIHYHFPWPFADILHFCVQPLKPTVLTYHSDIVRQKLLGRLYSPLMYKMLHSTDAIVATSPAYAMSSPTLSRANLREKLRIIPLGISEDSYPTEGDDSILSRMGILSTEPYFLFVGAFRYYKGLHTLVHAARGIQAKIVLAGSGPEELKLRALASELGVENVMFIGSVSEAEKISLLKHCRALVLPSHLRSEAFGVVLIEAAMLAKPLVSCEIASGTSFVNMDGQSGFVIPPENVDALVHALRQLLSNIELAINLGLGARLRYERMFAGRALGNAYSSLYREVVGAHF